MANEILDYLCDAAAGGYDWADAYRMTAQVFGVDEGVVQDIYHTFIDEAAAAF